MSTEENLQVALIEQLVHVLRPTTCSLSQHYGLRQLNDVQTAMLSQCLMYRCPEGGGASAARALQLPDRGERQPSAAPSSPHGRSRH